MSDTEAYKESIITDNGELIERARVQGDIKAGLFATEVEKKGKIKGGPTGETAINNDTKTYRIPDKLGRLIDKAKDTEVKEVKETNDDKQYILPEETSLTKSRVSGEDIEHVDWSKSKFLKKKKKRNGN